MRAAYQRGLTQRAIAHEFGPSRKTVRRFLQATEFPEQGAMAPPHWSGTVSGVPGEEVGLRMSQTQVGMGGNCRKKATRDSAVA